MLAISPQEIATFDLSSFKQTLNNSFFINYLLLVISFCLVLNYFHLHKLKNRVLN